MPHTVETLETPLRGAESLARLCGACCGLLVFGAMIITGLLARNPIETIVLRAVGGLFGGLFLGMFAGWIGCFVVRDNIAEAEEDSSAPEQSPADRAEMPQVGASTQA